MKAPLHSAAVSKIRLRMVYKPRVTHARSANNRTVRANPPNPRTRGSRDPDYNRPMLMRPQCRALIGAVLIALALATGGRPHRTTLLAAQAAAPAPAAQAAARVDGDRLIKDVQVLAAPDMEGRLTGTAGNKRAQAYILEQFKQLELRPIDGGFEQKFSFTSNAAAARNFPTRPISSRCCPGPRSPTATCW